MKKGFILLIVISLLGILIFVIINFFLLSTSHKALIQNHLNQIHANILAYSGYEYGLAKTKNLWSFTQLKKELITIGGETHGFSKDIVAVTLKDFNGKININDGIRAGKLEEPVLQTLDITYQYNSQATNPWMLIAPEYTSVTLDYSAYINLRLRKILNAYGDVHRFVDSIYDDDHKNCNQPKNYGKELPTPVYSTRAPLVYDTLLLNKKFLGSSDSPMRSPMSSVKNLDLNNYNNGLGERIIEARPQTGYQHLNEIQSIVDMWASEPGISFSEDYLKDHTFFELIKDDLTINSFEDDQFYRYEPPFGSANYQKAPKHGDFYIQYLFRDLDRLHLSKPLISGGTGQYHTSVWRDHSVPLININQASFFVKAAIFYAPSNVEYLCEGANTVPPYYGNQNTPNLGNDNFEMTTALESMIAIPHFGVAYQTFHPDLEANENGFQHVGRKSHLMSLRDAMYLAQQYETYVTDQKEILSFDDFKKFLIWHENNSTIGFPSYERAHPLRSYSVTLDGVDFNAGGLFHISEYTKIGSSPNYGEFSEDYVSHTLPHILSCIRRLPSYLNAPLALQSPYIVLKPNSLAYANNEGKCAQPFKKVEDFVIRATHPKICFLPCGYFDIHSQASLKDLNNIEISKAIIQATLKSFETQYFRSQEDFIALTDPSQTDQNIKIGPEHLDITLTPNQLANKKITHPIIEYLGTVGLNDFDQDITLGDQYSNFKPQIIMNFNPNIINGLSNTSLEPFAPAPQRAVSDPWINAIETQNPGSIFFSLAYSDMYGSDQPIFPEPVNPDLYSNLSPFNGVAFLELNKHFHFTQGQNPYSGDGFQDSLYWRLDDWLNLNEPVGSSVSSGIMTFWFRMPSNYDFPHDLDKGISKITPLSLSRVLVSLNFWESFDNTSDNPTMYRPVALTVGLKKTAKRGQNIFARYDCGGPPHLQNMSSQFVRYIGPVIGLNDYNQLKPSQRATFPSLSYQEYNYLGFLCSSAGEPQSYDAYRSAAYRSSEVSVRLKSVPESGPGSWQRVLVGWNLRWPGVGKSLTSKNQLWIRLLTNTNKWGEASQDYENEIHENYNFGNYTTDLLTNPQNPLVLKSPSPTYPGGDTQIGGGLGWMLPFNAAMVLSLGESQSKRLKNYSFLEDFFGDFQYTSMQGLYYPFWRLNSSIDNFRFYMGPSDPSKSALDQKYSDPTSSLYSDTTLKNNIFSAMRYNVTRANWHPEMPIGSHVEPQWMIDPQLPNQSQILSIGTRVYYPPDTHGNTAYVKLSASDIQGEIIPNGHTSQNEQNLFYASYRTGVNSINNPFRVSLQYMAHKPKLNGNQQDIGDPLEYFGNVSTGGDHFTNLAWVKELSLRFTPPNHPKILSLELNKNN